jgi:hypothetical protein
MEAQVRPRQGAAARPLRSQPRSTSLPVSAPLRGTQKCGGLNWSAQRLLEDL